MIGNATTTPYGIYVFRGETLTAGAKIHGVGLPVGVVPVGETTLAGSRGTVIEGAFKNVRLLGDFDQEGFGPASSDLGMVRYSASTWGVSAASVVSASAQTR